MWDDFMNSLDGSQEDLEGIVGEIAEEFLAENGDELNKEIVDLTNDLSGILNEVINSVTIDNAGATDEALESHGMLMNKVERQSKSEPDSSIYQAVGLSAVAAAAVGVIYLASTRKNRNQ